MLSSQFELQVLVSNHPIREFGHQGKTYVEGRRGQAFTLKFRNNSPSRVLVVPAIDGISTLNAQPATGQSRGYVVAGYSALEVKGWKINLDDTAEFIFTDKSHSYAGQVAGDANSGVIGMLVFAEKVVATPIVWMNVPPSVEHHHHYYPPPVYQPPFYGAPIITCGGSAFMSATSVAGVQPDVTVNNMTTNVGAVTPTDAQAPDFNLGTGWGKQITDRVVETEFERGLQLALLEIFYSDEAGLLRAGLQLKKEPAVSKAFPQSFGGFCTPPKITS